MVNKETMVMEEIKRKDGIYVYPMWIRREKPKKEEEGKTWSTAATTGTTGAKYFTADMVEGENSQNPFEDLF